MVDTSRALAAVVVAALVYTGAVVSLLHLAVNWWLRRSGRLAAPPAGAGRGRLARARTVVRSLNFAAAALIALCCLYARLIEPGWPQVERVRIETDKLPAGARPLRVVLIADTHCDPVERAEPRVAELIEGLAPDVVIFAGDAINSAEGLPVFRRFMTRVAKVAPTYAVRGNWEVWWFQHLEVCADTGAQVLDGQAVPLRVGASEIWLCGAAVENRDGLRAALARVPAGRFALAVHHFPEVAAATLGDGADLAVAGDTHGGQVRLPLLGALVRISRLSLNGYWDVGLHRIGRGHLYVNRGTGMEGGRAPRVRFRCRPEVTLIEIAPAAPKR
jgi:predicted MPP superfamily phosphohydrolase